MKRKEGFMLNNIADSYVVIPTGNNVVNFNALMTLNETGATLWNALATDTTVDELAAVLVTAYGIDAETAKTDVMDFIKTLQEAQLLED